MGDAEGEEKINGVAVGVGDGFGCGVVEGETLSELYTSS